MQTKQKQKGGVLGLGKDVICCMHVETSLLWFISGHAWLSEGIEGDLLGVTSTGDAEYPTSAVDSGTSGNKKIK